MSFYTVKPVLRTMKLNTLFTHLDSWDTTNGFYYGVLMWSHPNIPKRLKHYTL